MSANETSDGRTEGRSTDSEGGSGYVHVPGALDEEGAGGERDGPEAGFHGVHPEAADREFNWRGWVLVGVVVFAFVIAPMTILLWPPDVGFRFGYLVLPMLPAILLGLVGVWATTRP